ncbi:MAG: hypothetical protein ACFFCW_30730 [Candidatus Hodarchaeota archaeon]
MDIKKIIKRIIDDQVGMIYTDAGNGSGGPGFAEPDTLQEMLDLGNFDDAEIVDFDRELFEDAAGGIASVDDTEWVQIEFNWSDETQNPYHQIGWIWKE